MPQMIPVSSRRALATRGVAVLAALLVTACYFGPKLADFPAATQPVGADVKLVRRGWSLAGELVAVRDTAVLVRQDRHLVLVPWRRVTAVVVPKMGEFMIGGRPPRREVRDRLRRVSRFPQDMTPEVERALLATLGRDSVEVER